MLLYNNEGKVIGDIDIPGYEKVIHCIDCGYYDLNKEECMCLFPVKKRCTDPSFYCGWALPKKKNGAVEIPPEDSEGW